MTAPSQQVVSGYGTGVKDLLLNVGEVKKSTTAPISAVGFTLVALSSFMAFALSLVFSELWVPVDSCKLTPAGVTAWVFWAATLMVNVLYLAILLMRSPRAKNVCVMTSVFNFNFLACYVGAVCGLVDNEYVCAVQKADNDDTGLYVLLSSIVHSVVFIMHVHATNYILVARDRLRVHNTADAVERGFAKRPYVSTATTVTPELKMHLLDPFFLFVSVVLTVGIVIFTAAGQFIAGIVLMSVGGSFYLCVCFFGAYFEPLWNSGSRTAEASYQIESTRLSNIKVYFTCECYHNETSTSIDSSGNVKTSTKKVVTYKGKQEFKYTTVVETSNRLDTEGFDVVSVECTKKFFLGNPETKAMYDAEYKAFQLENKNKDTHFSHAVASELQGFSASVMGVRPGMQKPFWLTWFYYIHALFVPVMGYVYRRAFDAAVGKVTYEHKYIIQKTA